MRGGDGEIREGRPQGLSITDIAELTGAIARRSARGSSSRPAALRSLNPPQPSLLDPSMLCIDQSVGAASR